MKKLFKLATTCAIMLSTSASFADLDLKKVKSIFPQAKIVSTIELKPNYFEVQMIEKNSVVKKTHFYTNNTVDFIATKFVFTTPEEEAKFGITKPTFDYSDINLSDFATFTYGEGEERNYFLTIPSEKSISELKKIFAGNGFKNNVFLPFDTENYLQLLYNLPIFSGNNANRIKEAKITIDAIEKINKDLLNEQQAEKYLTSRLLRITKSSSPETLDEMAITMQAAVELKSIFAKEEDFSVLNTDRKATEASIKPLPQIIANHEFTDDELTNNWQGILSNATSYTIGTGKTKVFLFSDIDCPICVSLDHKLNTSLSPDYSVSVIYMPIQNIHPESLDKTRYILSLPESERWGMAGAIQGTTLDAELPREALALLPKATLSKIDKKISVSVSLSRILNVTGTPTAFKLIDSPSGKKLQMINPQSTITSNLNP